MIDFEKYINQEILISHLGKRTLMEGVLQEIIPAAASENYVDTLVVETEDKTLHINTNEILQFFPKKEWDDRNTRYYYVIFRYGKTSKSKEHIYMSHDYSIKPGDKVLVWQDWMYVPNATHSLQVSRNSSTAVVVLKSSRTNTIWTNYNVEISTENKQSYKYNRFAKQSRTVIFLLKISILRVARLFD